MVDAFLDRFSKSRRQRKDPEGQRMTGAPVSNEGMDVLDTFHTPPLPMDIPSQVRRLSTVILNTLGTSFPVVKQGWDRVLTNLLDKKHSSEVLRDVFDYANTHHRRDLLLITEHGPKAFENNFDRLYSAMQQQTQVEKTEVAQ